MNYYEFHGSTIYDERRKILENAEYNPKLKNFEIIPNTFSHEKKLYYFLTEHHGQITSFFELNTNKENAQCDAYFELL